MRMNALVPEELQIFESLPQNYLLLSPELDILAASDAYLKTTGKIRAEITGKNLFTVFPVSPAWSPGTDGGMQNSLNEVLKTGEQHEIPLTRYDVPDQENPAILQERYWKTLNKPVKDAAGKIRYIIHHSEEVTAEVIATRKANRLNEQMELLFHDIPAQIAIVTGEDLVYEYVNPQYERELFPGRDVLGMPLLTALPEVKGQPIWDILQKVYKTGEAFIKNEIQVPLAKKTGGPLQQHYFNTVYHPLRNEAGGIYGILSFKYEVTTHVEARMNLEKAKAELSAANEQLSESIKALQSAHEELQSSNEELVATNEELLTAQESLSVLNTKLEQRVFDRTRRLQESIEKEQSLNEEITAANEELTSANEQLSATNEELHETQDLLKESLEGLTASDQRFRNLIRDVNVGIILLSGTDFTVDIVNDEYGQLIGHTAATLQGQALFQVIPEAEAVFRPIIEGVRNTGEVLYLYDQPYFIQNNDTPIAGFLNLVYQPYREDDGSITGVMVICQDVTEQVNARQKLQQSEQRFRFMLNAIPQQVWTANPDGSFNYVNDVIGRDFGYEGQQIIGKGWQRFVHPDDLQVCIDSWQHARLANTEYHAEFRLRMKGGNYVWHLARAVPYLENGKTTLWLGTNTNIDLQKSNEQKKDEFLSIASHELKTPLTSIKGFNQLMQRVKDPVKLQSFINKSVEQVFRLEKLINDLLDVTRINAGKMAYDMQPFDFPEMLEDAIESVQMKSDRHQLILAEADPVVYTGDRLRLEQVINNFLTNAIKYSPEADKVLVRSTLEHDSIVVSVQDFGIGIPETHLDKLFDRYYRVDNTVMRFEGLGLGLFISSEILKRHQGTFWIESEQGKGSTFFFRLPLQMDSPEPIVIQEDGYYKDEHITIIYNPQKNRFDVDWTGYQDVTSVKRGGMLMLEMMKEKQVYKILNDNTHVLGNWSEAADWAGQEWFPMMEAAGLRYFAWVYSPSTFSKFSAEKSVSVMQGNVVTQFFGDLGGAMQWLDDLG